MSDIPWYEQTHTFRAYEYAFKNGLVVKAKVKHYTNGNTVLFYTEKNGASPSEAQIRTLLDGIRNSLLHTEKYEEFSIEPHKKLDLLALEFRPMEPYKSADEIVHDFDHAINLASLAMGNDFLELAHESRFSSSNPFKQ